MYNGLINIYKEPGFTSFDVVAVLRGILKQKKIGHTGTLDPDAEGVLLVCLGNATKLCDMLENRSKEYECRMLLGTTTDTEDTSGAVIATKDVNCSEQEIMEAINSFVGEYDQIPPMYSALKVNGKKLYELARQGIEIERQARKIYINSIRDISIDGMYATFKVDCSKGTYIRSLCRDIGEKLGCGACMDHLTRLRVSDFSIESALKLDDIKKYAAAEELDRFIIPTENAFMDAPALYINENSRKFIDNGNPLIVSNFRMDKGYEASKAIDGQRFRIYNADDKFVATYIFCEEKNEFKPEKMFF